MNAAEISRMVERYTFGALLGVLLSVVFIRLFLFLVDVSPWGFAAIMIVGAWTGIFLTHANLKSDDRIYGTLRSTTPQLRAICLKTMLWLLGSAALFGVFTVLTANYDVLGRFFSTVLVTALAVGFLWRLTLLLENAKTQKAGLFGVTNVVVVFCLTLALIWDWDWDKFDECLFSLSLTIGLTAPLGVASLLMVTKPKLQLTGRVGFVLYVLTLANFSLPAIFYGFWSGNSWDWWERAWINLVYGGIFAACVSGWPLANWLKNWRWFGVVSCVIAWTISLTTDRFSSIPDYPFFFLSTTVAGVFGYMSLMSLVPLLPRQQWIRWCTIGALVVSVSLINYKVSVLGSSHFGFSGRVAGAVGILAAFGTLAVVVLYLLRPSEVSILTKDGMNEIRLFCPRCGQKQSLKLGGAQCANCDLAIVVQIRDRGQLPPNDLAQIIEVESS